MTYASGRDETPEPRLRVESRELIGGRLGLACSARRQAARPMSCHLWRSPRSTPLPPRGRHASPLSSLVIELEEEAFAHVAGRRHLEDRASGMRSISSASAVAPSPPRQEADPRRRGRGRRILGTGGSSSSSVLPALRPRVGPPAAPTPLRQLLVGDSLHLVEGGLEILSSPMFRNCSAGEALTRGRGRGGRAVHGDGSSRSGSRPRPARGTHDLIASARGPLRCRSR